MRVFQKIGGGPSAIAQWVKLPLGKLVSCIELLVQVPPAPLPFQSESMKTQFFSPIIKNTSQEQSSAFLVAQGEVTSPPDSRFCFIFLICIF